MPEVWNEDAPNAHVVAYSDSSPTYYDNLANSWDASLNRMLSTTPEDPDYWKKLAAATPTNPIDLGYDPFTGFNYSKTATGEDNIFSPVNVFGVETENSMAQRAILEQQAAADAAAAAAANKPGLGSQLAYGVLGAATGIPGSIIQTGVNALGGLNQPVIEGGTLPTYYTSGAPATELQAYPDWMSAPTSTAATNISGMGGGVPAAATAQTATPATSTPSTAAGEKPSDVIVADPFQVTSTGLPTATLGGTGLSGIGTGGTDITGGGQGAGGATSTGTVSLPSVIVSDTKIETPKTGSLAGMLFSNAGYTFNPSTGTYTMPAVKADPGAGTTTSSTISTSNTPINFAGFQSAYPVAGPYAPGTAKPGSTASSTGTSTITDTGGTGTGAGGGGAGGGSTSTGTSNMPTERNLKAELEKSLAALQFNQQGLMDMYGGIYQNLLGQTMLGNANQPGLTSSIGQQLAADQAKLQRIQSGQLAAEDVRNATQQAREAYASRGQVMGPGAIGAEILNREAIRQQRENEARAAYQASIGNALNATQLQTGNIFNPIGSLVQSTFNPLGAYPQDVYSSNYNAAMAQQIAAMNNAAAIEAAKYGANASQQAATTSGLANILGKVAGNIDWTKAFGLG